MADTTIIDRLRERAKKHRDEVAECSEVPLTFDTLPVTLEADEEPLPCKWCATRAVDAQVMAEAADALTAAHAQLTALTADRHDRVAQTVALQRDLDEARFAIDQAQRLVASLDAQRAALTTALRGRDEARAKLANHQAGRPTA